STAKIPRQLLSHLAGTPVRGGEAVRKALTHVQQTRSPAARKPAMRSLLKRFRQMISARRPAARTAGFRPTLEALEDRSLMSITVTNPASTLGQTMNIAVRGDYFPNTLHTVELRQRPDNPAVTEIRELADNAIVDTFSLPHVQAPSRIYIDIGEDIDTV